MEAPNFVTKKEIAEMYRVTVVTVHRWMKQGMIPYLKIGRRVLFDKQKVVDQLTQNFEVKELTHESQTN